MTLKLHPKTKKASFHFSFKVNLSTCKRANELRYYFKDIIKEYGLLKDDKYIGEPEIICKVLNGGK